MRRTVDALAEALKANEPDVVACVADSKADYESKTSLIEKNTGWYGKHEKSLEEAVKAVNDSKLEKTVSDAERLLKNSDGKVADAATRDELSKAVKARDADKIAAASKKVNDSVTAKTKADEEAQRKAEEEAARTGRPHRPRRSSRIRRRNSRTRPRIQAVRHRVAAVPAACRTSFQAAEVSDARQTALRPQAMD